jgi:uncharacterized membrane protein
VTGAPDALLHLAPGSPAWLVVAADLALVLHIGGGAIGLVSGSAAVALRKGERAHRWAGRVFVVSMLTMATVAAIVAPFTARPTNLTGGLFTLYLVATAWATVRRRPGELGVFEVGAFLFALGAVAVDLAFIQLAAADPGRILGGQPAGALWIVAAAAALAAGLDLRMILAGGLTAAQRVRRHLWRMCAALFVASGSFFLGQQQVFPAPLRGSPLLALLAIAPLLAMTAWLVRLRFAGRFNAAHADRPWLAPSSTP